MLQEPTGGDVGAPLQHFGHNGWPSGCIHHAFGFVGWAPIWGHSLHNGGHSHIESSTPSSASGGAQFRIIDIGATGEVLGTDPNEDMVPPILACVSLGGFEGG